MYTSGSSAGVRPNLAGHTAEVHWDIGFFCKGNLAGGDDIYSLGSLHSTFVPASIALMPVNVACTDPNYNQFQSSQLPWNINWYQQSGIDVTWQGQACNNTPNFCGGSFQGDCFAPTAESNYPMDVWVRGPIGIDPWAGKPVPAN